MTPLSIRRSNESLPVGNPMGHMGMFCNPLALCYLPVYAWLTNGTRRGHGHGFFVPSWPPTSPGRSNSSLRAARRTAGGCAVIYARMQFAGHAGLELFLGATAIVLSLIGSVWFLGGTRRLHIMASRFSPVFMIPSGVLYNRSPPSAESASRRPNGR